jgi:dihydroorotase-like cyclic amidohydrolase
MSTIDLVIKGGQLPNGRKADIAIAGEQIVEVSDSFTGQASKSIDAKGCIVLPGLVDLHTHLREPGREDAETVLSGSRAGVKGGFTALSAMANTSPDWDRKQVCLMFFPSVRLRKVWKERHFLKSVQWRIRLPK